MPFPLAGSLWLRLGAVAALVAFGYGALRLAGGANQAATAPPTPPPGALDPTNRPVLIEAGSFIMGGDGTVGHPSPSSPFSTYDEGNGRSLGVRGFWLQEHEVTNEEFRRVFPSHDFPAGRERHPVVNVSIREALAYADSLGGTLPTEVQWEFAARGTTSRKYPWGDSEPDCARAHFADCEPTGTIEVMSRPEGATPEGVHDLAGNVWEWVVPLWFETGRTPVNDDSRRMRGGAFNDDPFFLRASNRSLRFPDGFRDAGVGFRVLWALE